MKLVWDESAWDDKQWQTQDRRILRRIHTLIRDVERNGNEGIGKPEPRKHGVHAYRSRRITDEHRLIDKLGDDEIRIAACRYHYARRACPLTAQSIGEGPARAGGAVPSSYGSVTTRDGPHLRVHASVP
jgi:toxin YoeB